MPTVELAGRGTVAYQWTGEGPEVLVLINGSVFNYHQWDGQALPILQDGLAGRCRILQYDYVGIGGSSPKKAPFSMLDLTDELRDLLDALELGSVHLLGISKGSMVGQAFLFRHPERAKSFCGLGNPHLLSKHIAPTFDSFSQRIVALETIKELWPQRIDRRNVHRVFNQVYVPALMGKDYKSLSLRERARAFFIRRMIFPSLEGTYVQTMVDLFRYYVDGLGAEAPAYAEGLSQIGDIPILLLNGTADDTTPVEMSRELVQMLPGAELVEFEGVTHMGVMMVEKMGRPVFERYVSFLNEILGSSNKQNQRTR